MNNEILKQITKQIKKYELVDSFTDEQEVEKWILKLNQTQIDNFINLDIDLKEIKNLKHLLINSDLLNCKDYQQKVEAISKLKNGHGCWHLFDNICNPNFLQSKNFYKDIEMLSKADTARYGLWILGKDDFINSPYHDEDLKLLVETHDINIENPLDFVVSDAIATVAGNIDSIKSPYHRADIRLIANSGSNCLQTSSSYPKDSINNLAIDKVSLKDIYHFENMQILATNPIASEFLYMIMTDSNFVNGENYRKEIKALLTAKSKITARALYYYIVNPERKYLRDIDFINDCINESIDSHVFDINSVAGINDQNYLQNLIKINKIDDKFVMYFISLLMNSEFIDSSYKNFDLELIQSITNKSIFIDLYNLMMNKTFLNSKHHKKDAIIISQCTVDKNRRLLLEKACQLYSINSINHEFDMEYILKLDLDSITKEIYSQMEYYLFTKNGINDLQHKQKLEKLLQGELIEDSCAQAFEAAPTTCSKPKILNLLKKIIKKEDDFLV